MRSPYLLFARDSRSVPPNEPVPGLAPAWVSLRRIDPHADPTAPPVLADVSPLPAIWDVGGGQYLFWFDGSQGQAFGRVDMGPGLADQADRLVDVLLSDPPPTPPASLTDRQALDGFASVLRSFARVAHDTTV